MESTTSNQVLFNDIYKPEHFRALGHQLIDLLADQLETVQQDRQAKVYPHEDPELQLAYFNEFLKEKGDPYATFKTILERSTQLQHPGFIGHQTAVPSPITAFAGLFSDFLNNGTGVYEMGPASNAMERTVIDFTAKHIGYTEQAAGFITSGGTLANLTALLAARKAKAPSDIWEEGHNEKLAVMVSEEAHYCIDRAARILGIGSEGIIKVPVDADFKIRAEILEASLKNAQDKGYHVFCLIGCAGSTATGSYDDLDALATFAAKHAIWLHVDAAHGGGVVFSKKHRHLVKGIAQADTVVLDYHKLLMTPALNTALIFKDGQLSYQTFAQKAQYLWDAPDHDEWYHSAKRTFECTKSLMSAKVFINLKTYGTDIFEKNVDHLYASAQVLSDLIRDRNDFELALVPESNIVNFRYLPAGVTDDEDLNTINGRIRQELIEEGAFYIVQTHIKGIRYLRCTVMNPLTTTDDFERLLDSIAALGHIATS